MIDYDKDIFLRKRILPDTLEAFGFDDGVYQEDFLDGDFRAVIQVDKKGKVRSIVYDLMAEEEYVQVRNEQYNGAYVGKVREEYVKILQKVADNCCTELLFEEDQANRIAAALKDKYGDDPDFPWDDVNGVWRCSNTKWYALMMYVDRAKLDHTKEGQTNVLNLKINEEDGEALRETVGIYEAYHMNHKSWISVMVDDTLPDSIILYLIERSRAIVMGRRVGASKTWIVPANPKYYDIIAAFTGTDDTIWKQCKGITKGDVVYMYVAAPYSAILYKCTVTATNIRSTSNRELMKVHIDERYSPKLCRLNTMKQFGVTTVRGPRFMPEELENYIKENNK